MRSAALLLVATVSLSALACSKKTPEPTKTTAVQASPLPPAAQAAKDAISGDGKLDPNDPKHGTRKLMGLDTPVYVDGVQVAVFRYGELPPIPVHMTESGGARYTMFEYLKGIGVDVDAMKSVHFHGNADRIASLEGSELRKEKGRFEFSFASGDSGAPMQKWDSTSLKNEFIVHEIRHMSIYVKKPSPAIHATKQCHVAADGECTDAIPYADGQIAKGTRVYVDGKMVGFVKRRQVTDAMIIGTAAADASDTKYAVAKLLSGMNVDVNAIKSLDVMAGDDVIARATGERFLALASSTTFTLPAHNHGKVRINVPAEFQAQAAGVKDQDALVSAVLVYKNTTSPVARDLVAISQDTDLSVQLAAIDDARGKLRRAE